jgi:hypothetical protein
MHLRLALALLVLLASQACGGDDDDRPGLADAGPRPMEADARPEPQPIHCVGEPTGCDAFDLSLSSDCEAQLGCVADRACTKDYFFECYDLPTPGECAAVGCDWVGKCFGNGTTCLLAHSPGACDPAAGCRWDEYCDPLSRPDDEHCAPFADQTACEGATACAWTYMTCSGTPEPCADQLDEAGCAAHTGCTWQP